MQNHTDSGTFCFIIPQLNMGISNEITIKCTKYGIKACDILRFLVCVQYIKFSFHYIYCQAKLRL